MLVDESFKVNIIAPSTPSTVSLPSEMSDLPPPHEYEMVIPVSNTWFSLLKS